MATEPDLLANYPNVESTMKNIGQYRNLMEELKISLTPELDLIDSRVIVPSKELGEIMKKIRKTITKREHKVSRRSSPPLGSVSGRSRTLTEVGFGPM
jgi:amphiphysin